MRSAGNFHPEWGYLAPAPSFMRMVRTALVATAIGAVAGAVVVVSLIERPGSNDSAIAAHALLTRAPVIASPTVVSRAAALVAVKSAPPAAQPQAQLSMATTTTTPAPAAAVPTAAATQPQNAPIADKRGSAGISPPLPLPAPMDATVAANNPVMDPVRVPAEADVAVVPDTVAEPRVPAKRSASKRRRYDTYRNEPYRRQDATGNRWHDNGGFAPLFRLFSSRSGSPYSSN
jgi:hypothetical protein